MRVTEKQVSKLQHLLKRNRDVVLAILRNRNVRRNAKRMTRSLIRLSQLESAETVESLEAELGDFVEQHLYRPLKDIRMGSLLTQLVQLLIRHNLKIPPVFYLLVSILRYGKI